MPTVRLEIKYSNDEYETVHHYVPIQSYSKYCSILDYHRNKVEFIKAIPSDLLLQDELIIAETEFKDYLRNISKIVSGCYDLFLAEKHDIDYTTP